MQFLTKAGLYTGFLLISEALFVEEILLMFRSMYIHGIYCVLLISFCFHRLSLQLGLVV